MTGSDGRTPGTDHATERSVQLESAAARSPCDLRRSRGFGLVVMLAGLVSAATLGLFRGTSVHDATVLVSVAAGAAVVAAVLGWLVLRSLRLHPVRDQAVAVALVVVASTAVGIVAASGAMFISSHDFTALLVVLVASGSAGSAAALRLGAHVDQGSRAVGELAQGISDGTAHNRVGAAVPTAELARLSAQIADVSAQLAEVRRREQALERSRRELITWISHDLRGPLTSIRAMAEAMEDGVVDDTRTTQRYHAAIRTEAERLSALVDDLFELSRITAGATPLHLKVVSLRALVDEAVDTVSARASRSGVILDRRYASLPSLEVSVPQFVRALHNLLDNAIRHTPAGGRIVVEGRRRPDGGAIVTVEDECGGIPDDDLSRVFDVAFRGDAARGRDGGGGLGLTIAKGLVEAHDGRLAVDNQAAGCRFTIDLPSYPAGVAAGVATPADVARGGAAAGESAAAAEVVPRAGT